VGYYPEDPDYPVHPPVRRALETTAKLLAAAGHDVVTLTNLPSIRSLEVTSETFWSSDKDPIFLQWMRESGEPMVPSLARDFGAIPPRPGGPSLDAVFEANNQAAAYKERWHQVWVENKLDVVLFPPAQTTAMPHDTFGSPPYTITFNLLQWPAIILPVGVADKEVDRDELATDARRKCTFKVMIIS
jgi:amidase